MDDVEPRPYFQILHSLCATGELDWEADENLERIQWVKRNWSRLSKCTSTDERRLLHIYMQHFAKHGEAASVRDLDELIRSMHQNTPMLDLLSSYQKDHQPHLAVLPASSLSVYLDQRESDWDKFRVTRVLRIASEIVVGSIQDTIVKGKFWIGPADALKYLSMKMQAGLLLEHREVPGGDTATTGMESLMERLQIAIDGQSGQIVTGYPPLDDSLSIGFKHGNQIKELLIAGFTGHGKSTLLMNVIYRAAAQGNRVLLVPRECTVEQAWDRLVYLHADANGRARELPPLKRFLRRGYAKPEHKAVFASIKAEMLAQNIRIDVLGLNTWAEVESAVTAHVQDPYDVLAIDYIAHLQPPDNIRASDFNQAILQTFRAAQKLSIDYEKGRGLVVISPMQTNKESAKEAGNGLPLEKGVYQTVGCIEQYTGAGRDADAVIGYWSADELKTNGLAKISCIKSRDDNFEPFYVRLDPHTQTLNFVRNAEAITLIGQAGTGLPDDKDPARRGQRRSKRRATQTPTPNDNRIVDAEVI